jgi:hypothetical protein
MDVILSQQLRASLNNTSYRTYPPAGKSFHSTTLSTVAQDYPHPQKLYFNTVILKDFQFTTFKSVFFGKIHFVSFRDTEIKP